MTIGSIDHEAMRSELNRLQKRIDDLYIVLTLCIAVGVLLGSLALKIA